jgi:hypothetical protein
MNDEIVIDTGIEMTDRDVMIDLVSPVKTSTETRISPIA